MANKDAGKGEEDTLESPSVARKRHAQCLMNFCSFPKTGTGVCIDFSFPLGASV